MKAVFIMFLIAIVLVALHFVVYSRKVLPLPVNRPPPFSSHLSSVPSSPNETRRKLSAETPADDHFDFSKRPEVTSVGELKAHYDGILRELKAQSSSILKIRSRMKKVLGDRYSRCPSYFIDLGSRAIDSTMKFMKYFPSAKEFAIHCFEANPAFNHLYVKYNKRRLDSGLSPIHHYNVAAGVENSVMKLSQRSVGSSLVNDGESTDSIEVQVIDFVQFISNLTQQATSGCSYVVLKMDIEKMEFAILNHLLTSKFIAFVDDLLLECHYTTNLPRARRRPGDLGIDDCKHLVERFNAELKAPDLNVRGFEAVLWNNAKVARKSGYVSRHGGFYPT